MSAARLIVTMLALVAAMAMPANAPLAAAHAPAARIAIGFIGDSITGEIPSGGTQPPPELTARLLSTSGHTVYAVNQGHRGSTTADWLPHSRYGYLPLALNTFAR